MISYDGLSCPGCEGPLEPRVLECGSCRIRVEGGFVFSEFAHLREDDLQFCGSS